MNIQKFLVIVSFSVSLQAAASEYSYESIASRNNESLLSEEIVNAAKMQGECLVGLKELNFAKKEDFDPVAEWTNYRSVSLLEQYSPCEVLIMMEVAQSKLRKSK